jgi:hypothetical protein
MNLVQIQERLKDAPTQAIMQYANGGNPMVPPYLALAELQRRDSINKSAANQQALAQGAQPSVKEQVEQAAGLAALQKQTQAKGLQSLMGAGVPVPSVPAPDRQPQAEGVATLPTNEMYNFAEGGIIGYARGDLVGGLPDYESRTLSIQQLEDEYKRALRAGKPAQANAIRDAINAREKDQGSIRTPVAEMDAAPSAQQAPDFGFQGDKSDIARQIAAIQDPQERQRAAAQLQQEIASGNPALRTSAAPAQPSEDRSLAAREMPRAGIATLPGADESLRTITGLMAPPSTKQSIDTEREFAKAYGIDQPYGEERMKRIQQMQAERQQMLEPRGTERLMRVLGGIAGRGLQGAGPAYLQAIEGERASDMDFRAKMDELMAGTEEKRRADLAAGAERARKEFATGRELQLGAAEKLFTAQQQRELKQAELDMRQLELKVAQARKLTPDEQWLMNYSGGNLDKFLEGTKKLAEAKAGPRTDIASERSRTALFNKYNENPMLKSQYKTFDEYLKAFEAATGETSANDPLMSKADAILFGRK